MGKNLIKMEREIKERLLKQDKRWPIEIVLTNNKKGWKENKMWIYNLHINWEIIDHPRRIAEIFRERQFCQEGYPEKFQEVFFSGKMGRWNLNDLQNINDRVLIAQPYKYDKEDLERLDKYCKENNLKYERRWISPYYIGAQMIVIYEDDSNVEKFVGEMLKIQDEEFGNFVDEKAKADHMKMTRMV